MKNLAFRIRYALPYKPRNLVAAVKTAITLVGLMISFLEIADYFFDTSQVRAFLKDKRWIILLLFLLVGLLKTRRKSKKRVKIQGTDVSIQIKVGDVLSEKEGAIVIPTNTTFDTIMENEFISVNSVQGQFQKRYYENQLTKLDGLISNGINGIEGIEIERPGCISEKKIRYPVGTVSKVSEVNNRFYFLAINDINVNGMPENPKYENIQVALGGLWQFIEECGNNEPISIPLIGTGKAGIRDATREGIIKEIIFSFMASVRERKITECLTVYVHPMDLKDTQLDMDEIFEYLDYVGKYKYSESNGRVAGEAV